MSQTSEHETDRDTATRSALRSSASPRGGRAGRWGARGGQPVPQSTPGRYAWSRALGSRTPSLRRGVLSGASDRWLSAVVHSAT